MKIYLFLDGWQQHANSFKKLDFGKWELFIPPNADGSCQIKHGSQVKVMSFAAQLFSFISCVYFMYQLVVENSNGELLDRISPWATYVVPPPIQDGFTYQHRIWHPEEVILRGFNH